MPHQTDEDHPKCLFYFYDIHRRYMVFNFQFAAKLTKKRQKSGKNKQKNEKNRGTNPSLHDLCPLLNDFSPLIPNNRRTFATE